MVTWREIILLLASAQGILLSLALFTRSGKQDRSNIFLGLIILIISLELLNDWGIQVHYHNSKNAIPFWLLESYLILPPSLWFFIKANIDPGFHFRLKHLIFFIPAFIEIVVETGKTIQYRLTGHPFNLLEIKAWFLFTEILPVLWMAATLIFYGINLYRFSYRYASGASPSARIHRIKMYGLFIVLLLLTLGWSAEVFVRLPIFIFIEILCVVFLFVLGYIGYAKPAFFDALKNGKKKLSEKQAFANYDDKKELDRLIQLFEQKALHTRPGLTIEELSRELGLPVRYVSYLINSYHATNFHHFINTYRVKEVIRKLNDPTQKHKTLLALAFESGFNSKSSFNEVFKNHTGQSPSRYLK